jgi:hypothetical protein
MSQQQVNFKGDSLQKISSTAFIIGAVLLIVFNLLSPRPNDPTSLQSVLTTISNQTVFTHLSQLFLAFGIWLAMIGSVGVYRSIKASGAAWARLGFYGIIVGATLWSITFGLGSTTVNTAADWVSASTADKAATLNVAAAETAATSAIETMSILMFWLALILLGIGMARSAVYPRWLGWLAAILGFAMVAAVGVPKFFFGNTSILLLLFGGLALITTIWMLATGIWVARRAW